MGHHSAGRKRPPTPYLLSETSQEPRQRSNVEPSTTPLCLRQRRDGQPENKKRRIPRGAGIRLVEPIGATGWRLWLMGRLRAVAGRAGGERLSHYSARTAGAGGSILGRTRCAEVTDARDRDTD